MQRMRREVATMKKPKTFEHIKVGMFVTLSDRKGIYRVLETYEVVIPGTTTHSLVKTKQVLSADFKQMPTGAVHDRFLDNCKPVDVSTIDKVIAAHRATINRLKALKAMFVNTQAPLSECARAAARRPSNYGRLSGEQQWEIDKELGILDWDGLS